MVFFKRIWPTIRASAAGKLLRQIATSSPRRSGGGRVPAFRPFPGLASWRGFVSVSLMASKRFSRLAKILAGAVADAGRDFSTRWPAGTLRPFLGAGHAAIYPPSLSGARFRAVLLHAAGADSAAWPSRLGVTSSLLKGTDQAKLDQFVEKMVASVTPPANIRTIHGGHSNSAESTAARIQSLKINSGGHECLWPARSNTPSTPNPSSP